VKRKESTGRNAYTWKICERTEEYEKTKKMELALCGREEE